MVKKECPSCAMEVNADSKTCPVCGYEFPRVTIGLKLIALLLALIILYFVFF
jgi:RNA polymerase subunit RPABC4/transcription elongation factor Spt4